MKNLFLFVMIILPTLIGAQTVSNLQVSTGASGSPSTVTFDVSWEKPVGPTAVWMDSAWVFVDYNKNGKMTRLLISGGTLTSHTANTGVSPDAGKLIILTGNDRGAWVTGDAWKQGNFSAEVMLLSDETTIAGACAYASGYPPVGKYVSETEIVFTGTPMYEIKLLHEDGFTVETIESGGTFLLPCSYTISSFTDATGAPGIINCMPPATYTLSGANVCVGDEVALTLAGSQSGWKYQLYNGSTPVGSSKDGGGALIFTDAFAAAGGHTYTVRTVDGGSVRCDMPVSNAHGIAVNAVGTVPGSTVHFTEIDPCPDAAIGTVRYLTDTRESVESPSNTQTYKVKKMADGHIWMVQDLKFGNLCDKPTFTGSRDVDQIDNLTTLTDKTYYGDCTNATNGSTPPNRGYLYDWAAAINKAGAYNGSLLDVGCSTLPSACQGICPVGWHIPTGSSGSEYRALHNATAGCLTSDDDCWDSSSAWEGVYGGNCAFTGSLYEQGEWGNYWSSSWSSATSSYILRYRAVSVVPGSAIAGPSSGLTVRCIMNY
jgi:uncharacterized protein (TIGR02145 family)